MSDYAVVNPATGETVKEYPTITDDDAATTRSARADAAHREWCRVDDGRGARGARPRASASCTPSARERARRDHRARDGQADRAGARRGRLLRRDLRVLRRQRGEAAGRRADRAARRRRLGVHPPQLARRPARDHAVELPLLPGGALRRARTWSIGNTILLKHAPQCPESAAAMEQIYHEAGFPDGRLHQHLRDQRADRVGHRRPARARRLADRLRARRRRRRRDRRAQPQEGRARARRLGPVHPAQHRRPRRGRRVRRRRRGSTTPASRATRPSGSSSSTSSTSRSWRSSPPR